MRLLWVLWLHWYIHLRWRLLLLLLQWWRCRAHWYIRNPPLL